jgi:uncharacterized membrane protein
MTIWCNSDLFVLIRNISHLGVAWFSYTWKLNLNSFLKCRLFVSWSFVFGLNGSMVSLLLMVGCYRLLNMLRLGLVLSSFCSGAHNFCYLQVPPGLVQAEVIWLGVVTTSMVSSCSPFRSLAPLRSL